MFRRFTLIAGPCVLEGDKLNLEVARAVKGWGETFGLRVIFKASFDKANRSKMASARGPGLRDGLELLAAVKAETGMTILTDVHEPGQVERVAQVVDVLQIPAFLCRQTDLLVAAGAAGKPVNIKKGQWMSPADMAGAVDKLRAAGAPDVAVTERGTFFGYGNLVVDMRTGAPLRKPPSFSTARIRFNAPARWTDRVAEIPSTCPHSFAPLSRRAATVCFSRPIRGRATHHPTDRTCCRWGGWRACYRR